MKKIILFWALIVIALVLDARTIKISVNSIKEFRTEKHENKNKRYFIIMKNNKKHELFNEAQYNAAMNLYFVKDSLTIKTK